MADKKPSIPKSTLEKWQRIINIVSDVYDVPAGLIMQASPPTHDVLVCSDTTNNPYEVGTKFQLNSGLYCDAVMNERKELIVHNAAISPEWCHNPDMEHGMIFYAGLPLVWPDGMIFGTICVLDRQDNPKVINYLNLLREFKKVVDMDLSFLVQLSVQKQLEQELQTSHDRLEERVSTRTKELRDSNQKLTAEIERRFRIEGILHQQEQELEETNIALRVLLHKMETSRSELEETMVGNIHNLILPYLEKLKHKCGSAEDALPYIALLEENMQDLTSSFSNKLAARFADLTPTEIEITQFVIQGKSTKEIAGILGRATSTVDFHRNNIRKKIGLSNKGQNLRSYLASLC